MSLFAKLSAAATALLLAACASTPATQYFSLPDSAFVPPAGQSSGQTAVQIILAEPLGQGGLVYQTDAHRLNFARHHLWAAPLDQSLAAAFSNRLNRHDRTQDLHRAIPRQLPRTHPRERLCPMAERPHHPIQYPNPAAGRRLPRHGGIPVPRPQPRCRYRGRALNIPPQASTKAT